MNIWIIYDSKFGNNKIIAEAIQSRLSQHEVHVVYAKKISPKQVIASNPEVLLFGGPRRAGNISFTLRHWIENFAKKMRAQNRQLTKSAAWETHGIFKEADLHPESKMEQNIINKNLNIGVKWKELINTLPVARPPPELVDFAVKDMQGPLEDGYLGKIDLFMEAFEKI